MATLRGSQKIHLQVVADTLKILLDFNDLEEIKAGIRGVISATEIIANKHSKNKQFKP